MPPLVSVVVPAYNHASYLPAALRSIEQQTYAAWETVVVDDGSTDDTSGMVSTWTDPRIRYIRQNNQGLSAARNTGISVARGEYLAFLDADDEWEPAFLATCLGVLSDRLDLAGVYTLNYYIDFQGLRLPQVGGECVRADCFQERNLEGGFFPVHAALVRTNIVREVGLFDTSLTSEEDWDLWLRIGQRYAMACIPVPLARYRVSPGSMSSNAERMHANGVAVLSKYFGRPEGDPASWTPEKRRAYAFAHRGAAYRFIQQQEPDMGWQHLKTAVTLWPQLFARVDTFYELICGDQSPGQRGKAEFLDLDRTWRQILDRLDTLFRGAEPQVLALHGAAYGNAYLALAMLNDQAGDWRAARRHLLQAARHHPRLISRTFLRRLAKLYLGASTARWLKSVGDRMKPPRTEATA